MPEKVTVGSSGSCDQAAGWCLYHWNESTREMEQLEGHCNPGYECPVPDPEAYGGSDALDLYDEYRIYVCCEASSSGGS